MDRKEQLYQDNVYVDCHPICSRKVTTTSEKRRGIFKYISCNEEWETQTNKKDFK